MVNIVRQRNFLASFFGNDMTIGDAIFYYQFDETYSYNRFFYRQYDYNFDILTYPGYVKLNCMADSVVDEVDRLSTLRLIWDAFQNPFISHLKAYNDLFLHWLLYLDRLASIAWHCFGRIKKIWICSKYGPIARNQFFEIIGALSNFTHLEEIIIELIFVKETVGFYEKFIKSNTDFDERINRLFSKNQNLQTVDLNFKISDSYMGTIFGKAFGNAILSHTSIHTLNLRNAKMGDLGCMSIAKGLTRNKSLRQLDLSLNDIGHKGARALADALKDSKLERLYLADNKIRDKGCVEITRALRGNQYLKKLNLIKNQIGEKGGAALARALEYKYSKLKVLRLGYNELGYDINNHGQQGGCKYIAASLCINKSLQELHLAENKIGNGSEVTTLAKAIEENTNLKVLYLRGNALGYLGCVKLSAALIKNRSLTEINLTNNGIGVIGACSLASALKHNSTIKILHLGRNQIQNEGCAEIAYASHGHTSVEEIHLNSNEIEEDGAMAWIDTIKSNSTLKVIDITGNDIGFAVGDFQELLWNNRDFTIIGLQTDVSHHDFARHWPGGELETIFIENDNLH